MNAIVAGKQEKPAGSLDWKSVLDIPVELNLNNSFLYSNAAYAYINSNTHHVKIDFVEGTTSIIPISRFLIITDISQQLVPRGSYLNLDGQRNFVYQGNFGLFIAFINTSGFQGLVMQVAGRNGDGGSVTITLLQEKVKSIQIGYFE